MVDENQTKTPEEGQVGDAAVESVSEEVVSDPEEGQSQEEGKASPSKYEELLAKKNWSNHNQVAEGYINLEAQTSRLAQQVAELQKKIGEPQQEEENDDDPYERVREIIREEIQPLNQVVHKSALDEAENEVKQVYGDGFDAIQQTGMYQKIKTTSLSSPNPVATYQELILGFLEMSNATGNPQTLVNSGIKQGQAIERSKTASHILGSGGSGAKIEKQSPKDFGDQIMDYAKSRRGF